MIDIDQARHVNEPLSSESYTVAFAASWLQLSQPTVRRMCDRGVLDAKKIGRAWLIEGDSLLEARSTGGGYTSPEGVSIVDAIRRVRKHDLRRELWRPDRLNGADFLADKVALEAIVIEKLAGRRVFDSIVRTDMPKNSVLFRRAADLSLSDRVAYEAIVNAMGEAMDRRISESVFNNRWETRAFHLSAVTRPWQTFALATRDAVESRDEPWLFKSDITSFFDNVNIRVLLAKLTEASVSPDLIVPLRRMLETWEIRPGYGLPVGPDASRLLANFYLSDVDESILGSPNVEYFRYMDDIRIVADSRSSGAFALSNFVSALERLGLSPSTHKTEALFGEAARNDVIEDDLRGEEYDRSEPGDVWSIIRGPDTAKVLREMFRDAVSATPTDLRRARYSLYRLAGERHSVKTSQIVTSHLEELAPLAPVVARYLEPWLSDRRLASSVLEYIASPERNVSEYLEHWLIAALTNNPDGLTQADYRIVRQRYLDQNHSVALRGALASLLVNSGNLSDVRMIERDLVGTPDARLARDLLAALAAIRKLQSSIRDRVERQIPATSPTCEYLSGRSGIAKIYLAPIRVGD